MNHSIHLRRGCHARVAALALALTVGAICAAQGFQKDHDALIEATATSRSDIASLTHRVESLESVRTGERLARIENQNENILWLLKGICAGLAGILGERILRSVKLTRRGVV